MNSFVEKNKLYRIATVLSILPKYWKSSKKIAEHVNATSRFSLYIDILTCLVKYGASDENYLQFRFYGNSDEYRDSFITWRRNMKIMKYTPQSVIDLFLDKAKFNHRFAKYIKRGWLNCNNANKDQILGFIRKYSSVIVKPMDSACGTGICRWTYSNINDVDVEKIVGKNYIIEETIENCPEIKILNPSSLNTLRIVTFTDKHSNVHILNIILRVGRSNAITDNAHAGGIACAVDIQTGRLKGLARTFKDEVFESHPNSGIQFSGYQIPRIKDCITFVTQLASEVPSARLVGWDVVITPTHLEVLEANIPPGEDLTELDLCGKYRKILALC